MALPDLDLCKAYLKVENTAEDALIGQLLSSAVAFIESYIGRAIYDPDGERVFGPVRAAYPVVQGLRVSDLAPNDRMELTAYDRLGRTTNLPLATQIMGALPMSTLPDYNARWEPLLSQAILDTVSEVYSQRNPMTDTMSAGGGVYERLARRVGGLSPRVRALLDPVYRLSNV